MLFYERKSRIAIFRNDDSTLFEEPTQKQEKSVENKQIKVMLFLTIVWAVELQLLHA